MARKSLVILLGMFLSAEKWRWLMLSCTTVILIATLALNVLLRPYSDHELVEADTERNGICKMATGVLLPSTWSLMDVLDTMVSRNDLEEVEQRMQQQLDAVGARALKDAAELDALRISVARQQVVAVDRLDKLEKQLKQADEAQVAAGIESVPEFVLDCVQNMGWPSFEWTDPRDGCEFTWCHAAGESAPGVINWVLVGIPEMGNPEANRVSAEACYQSREKDRRIAELEAELATAKQVIDSVSSAYWEWMSGSREWMSGSIIADKIGAIVRSLK
jgi:hypothetical protein